MPGKIDDVKAAELYQAGYSTSELAGMFNVIRPSIVRALHRQGVPIRRVVGRRISLSRPMTEAQLRRHAEVINGLWLAPSPSREPCFKCGVRGDVGCKCK